MLVCKFGGSSLATHGRLLRVAGIVHQNPRRRFIVVSAPGKRACADEKVTDLLIRWQEGSCGFSPIRARFMELARGLHMEEEVRADLDRAERDVKAFDPVSNARLRRDFAASRGEYILARILARQLQYAFVDAGDIIRFSEEGRLLAKEISHAIWDRLSRTRRAVIPGFYGTDPSGNIRTFPRGGSDITGALVAAAMGAEEYENWTDVCGFLSADPQIVPEAKCVPEIGYDQARILCAFGANVLHPDSILPVERAGIPTRIKNTFDPEHPGTILCRDANTSVPCVAGRLLGDGSAMIVAVPAIYCDTAQALLKCGIDILSRVNGKGHTALRVPSEQMEPCMRILAAGLNTVPSAQPLPAIYGNSYL